jgi:phosphomannomutase
MKLIMKFPEIMLSSFKSYDIRGIYPDSINEDFYYMLGNAFAQYIKTGVVMVGRDARLSSPSLAKAFIEGVTDFGLNVTDLGNISTEMLYFAAKEANPEGAVMITASHNPKDYNGAKFAIKDLVPLHGAFGLPEIKELCSKEPVIMVQKGIVTQKNVMNDWIQSLLAFINPSTLNPLKLVVDAGNGMAGPTWHKLVESLPSITFIPLFTNPDGTFPNHPSETSNPENLKFLVDKVKAEKADIGLAFDGDVDRIAVVDELGNVINGDVLGAFLVEYTLRQEKNKGRTVTYNATCGRVVKEVIESFGSTAVRTKAGHTLIKTGMREHNAVLGVELSGHYYFEFNNYTENMSVIGLWLLDELSKTGKKASELFTKYQKYVSSGEINFVVEDREKSLQALNDAFASKAQTVDTLDGYSFWFSNFWFNVRLSNTEPLLRLNVEGDTKEIMESNRNEIIAVIESTGAKRKTSH